MKGSNEFQNDLGLSKLFLDSCARNEAVKNYSSTVILSGLEERVATEEEQRILSEIIAGALNAIGFYACSDVRNRVDIIKNTAEYIAISFFGVESEINFYYTVNQRIQKIVGAFTEKGTEG